MKFLIYQGYEEKFRWRQVDDEGNMLAMSSLLDSEEEAIEAVKALNPDAEIENRVEHPDEDEE